MPQEILSSRVGVTPDTNVKLAERRSLMSLLAIVPTQKKGAKYYENLDDLVVASKYCICLLCYRSLLRCTPMPSRYLDG